MSSRRAVTQWRRVRRHTSLARIWRGRPKAGLEAKTVQVHIARMPDSDEIPVMEPFPDKAGTGWHVVIRYHEGHERRIEGFATKNDAVDWITANTTQLDK